jgi:hypothetical protein
MRDVQQSQGLVNAHSGVPSQGSHDLRLAGCDLRKPRRIRCNARRLEMEPITPVVYLFIIAQVGYFAQHSGILRRKSDRLWQWQRNAQAPPFDRIERKIKIGPRISGNTNTVSAVAYHTWGINAQRHDDWL